MRTRVLLGMDPHGDPIWGRAVIPVRGLRDRVAACRRGEAAPRDLFEIQTIGDIDVAAILADLTAA